MSFPEAQIVSGHMAISTGDLNKYLPAVVKAETLIAAGFKPHEKVKNGYWWRVGDQVPLICNWLQNVIGEVKLKAMGGR